MVNSKDIADLRSAELHPIAASYQSAKNYFLINVDPLYVRGWFGIPFCNHPFVDTVKELMLNSDLSYEHSALSIYHQNYQPANAAERCGLWSSCSLLTKYPPYSAVLPWFRSSPAQRKIRFEENYKDQNIRRGKDLPLEAGFGGYGPTSYEKGSLEVSALRNVLRSIQKHGYRPCPTKDGHISAYMLVHDDQSIRYLIRSGHHRTSVLCALGYSYFPLLLSSTNIVRRSDFAHWPMVRAGFFSINEALRVFDSVFEGRRPYKDVS